MSAHSDNLLCIHCGRPPGRSEVRQTFLLNRQFGCTQCGQNNTYPTTFTGLLNAGAALACGVGYIATLPDGSRTFSAPLNADDDAGGGSWLDSLLFYSPAVVFIACGLIVFGVYLKTSRDLHQARQKITTQKRSSHLGAA